MWSSDRGSRILKCKGHVSSLTQNSYGVWQLANNICPHVLMFINDTLILNDLGTTWSTYEGGFVPLFHPSKDDDLLVHQIVWSLPYMV